MQEVWQGGTLCPWMCCQAFPIPGKLAAVDRRGRIVEGTIQKMATDGNPPLSLFSIDTTKAYTVVGRLADGSTLNFIVDTGAAVILIRNDVWRRLASNQELPPWQGPRLVGVDGSPVKSQGSVTVPITIGDTMFQTRVVVASSMSVEAILGLGEQSLCRGFW